MQSSENLLNLSRSSGELHMLQQHNGELQDAVHML
jgi:hypothetical protein